MQGALSWLEGDAAHSMPTPEHAKTVGYLTRGLQLLSARLHLAAPEEAPALAPGTLIAPWAAAAAAAEDAEEPAAAGVEALQQGCNIEKVLHIHMLAPYTAGDLLGF